MRPLLTAALATAALVALSGCASADPRPGSAPAGAEGSAAATGVLAAETTADITLPPIGTGFDYQLGGASPVPAGVGIVVRDSTAEPAAGAYGVCYVNGFQTQPGETWPDDLLVQGDDGPLVDPNWDDESILDTSTAAKRTAIAARQATTVDRCADAGFPAVEFDNLDSWYRSAGALDADDALALATLLVDHAHSRGLAVAQNTPRTSGPAVATRPASTSRSPRRATAGRSAPTTRRSTGRTCSTWSTPTTCAARPTRCARGSWRWIPRPAP